MSEERVDFTVLPCGCTLEQVVVDGDRNELRYAPCHQDCEFFQYSLAETRKQGKPVERRVIS